ncbi:uncharacterized protein LOC101848815 [Aplysia californica]|uniref:RNA helicase n=1 Tax=Aplysia californica TaxID=6500 RepID=A0ABM0JNJ2_APLCA|nr:uncharacterized protein LOC101848815 [Aplysia californica]
MSVAHRLKEKERTHDVLITESVDFAGLLLSKPVLEGLNNAGFEMPSPIQLKAIPLGRCGLDLIVQAKSGTGKTCVFTVVALESIDSTTACVQTLVLAPTREIAQQIQSVVNTIGSTMAQLKCHTFIGGMPVLQDKILAKNCHIAVGTPGRVKQLIEIGALKTNSIRLFILDEADKLLEEGHFQESINWIYSSLPENKQILALSATYPEYLAHHLTSYMRNPTFVRLNITDPALIGIKQYHVVVPNHPLANIVFKAKTDVILNILNTVAFQQCLIFSNMQTRAQNLQSELEMRNWPTACIAGCLDQKERTFAMEQLKTYKCRILISTDLTSRGIDADKVNLVINLDVPHDSETYLHRIGRAGRFGSYGAAITVVSAGGQDKELWAVERKCKTHIQKLPDPIPHDLATRPVAVNLEDVVSTQQIITRPELAPDSLAGAVNAAPVTERKADGAGTVRNATMSVVAEEDGDGRGDRVDANCSSDLLSDESKTKDVADCSEAVNQSALTSNAKIQNVTDNAKAVHKTEANNRSAATNAEEEQICGPTSCDHGETVDKGCVDAEQISVVLEEEISAEVLEGRSTCDDKNTGQSQVPGMDCAKVTRDPGSEVPSNDEAVKECEEGTTAFSVDLSPCVPAESNEVNRASIQETALLLTDEERAAGRVCDDAVNPCDTESAENCGSGCEEVARFIDTVAAGIEKDAVLSAASSLCVSHEEVDEDAASQSNLEVSELQKSATLDDVSDSGWVGSKDSPVTDSHKHSDPNHHVEETSKVESYSETLSQDILTQVMNATKGLKQIKSRALLLIGSTADTEDKRVTKQFSCGAENENAQSALNLSTDTREPSVKIVLSKKPQVDEQSSKVIFKATSDEAEVSVSADDKSGISVGEDLRPEQSPKACLSDQKQTTTEGKVDLPKSSPKESNKWEPHKKMPRSFAVADFLRQINEEYRQMHSMKADEKSLSEQIQGQENQDVKHAGDGNEMKVRKGENCSLVEGNKTHLEVERSSETKNRISNVSVDERNKMIPNVQDLSNKEGNVDREFDRDPQTPQGSSVCENNPPQSSEVGVLVVSEEQVSNAGNDQAVLLSKKVDSCLTDGNVSLITVCSSQEKGELQDSGSSSLETFQLCEENRGQSLCLPQDAGTQETDSSCANISVKSVTCDEFTEADRGKLRSAFNSLLLYGAGKKQLTFDDFQKERGECDETDSNNFAEQDPFLHLMRGTDKVLRENQIDERLERMIQQDYMKVLEKQNQFYEKLKTVELPVKDSESADNSDGRKSTNKAGSADKGLKSDVHDSLGTKGFWSSSRGKKSGKGGKGRPSDSLNWRKPKEEEGSEDGGLNWRDGEDNQRRRPGWTKPGVSSSSNKSQVPQDNSSLEGETLGIDKGKEKDDDNVNDLKDKIGDMDKNKLCEVDKDFGMSTVQSKEHKDTADFQNEKRRGMDEECALLDQMHESMLRKRKERKRLAGSQVETAAKDHSSLRVVSGQEETDLPSSMADTVSRERGSLGESRSGLMSSESDAQRPDNDSQDSSVKETNKTLQTGESSFKASFEGGGRVRGSSDTRVGGTEKMENCSSAKITLSEKAMLNYTELGAEKSFKATSQAKEKERCEDDSVESSLKASRSSIFYTPDIPTKPSKSEARLAGIEVSDGSTSSTSGVTLSSTSDISDLNSSDNEIISDKSAPQCYANKYAEDLQRVRNVGYSRDGVKGRNVLSTQRSKTAHSDNRKLPHVDNAVCHKSHGNVAQFSKPMAPTKSKSERSKRKDNSTENNSSINYSRQRQVLDLWGDNSRYRGTEVKTSGPRHERSSVAERRKKSHLKDYSKEISSVSSWSSEENSSSCSSDVENVTPDHFEQYYGSMHSSWQVWPQQPSYAAPLPMQGPSDYVPNSNYPQMQQYPLYPSVYPFPYPQTFPQALPYAPVLPAHPAPPSSSLPWYGCVPGPYQSQPYSKGYYQPPAFAPPVRHPHTAYPLGPSYFITSQVQIQYVRHMTRALRYLRKKHGLTREEE